MALRDRSRSLLATIVGWVIVAVIAWLVLGFVVGVVRWIVRGVVVLALIIGLLWVYATLKAPSD